MEKINVIWNFELQKEPHVSQNMEKIKIKIGRLTSDFETVVKSIVFS